MSNDSVFGMPCWCNPLINGCIPVSMRFNRGKQLLPYRSRELEIAPNSYWGQQVSAISRSLVKSEDAPEMVDNSDKKA